MITTHPLPLLLCVVTALISAGVVGIPRWQVSEEDGNYIITDPKSVSLQQDKIQSTLLIFSKEINANDNSGSSSEENDSGSSSEESDSGSSSEESDSGSSESKENLSLKEAHVIHRRSLDSNQDSLNTLGKPSNQPLAKEVIITSKDDSQISETASDTNPAPTFADDSELPYYTPTESTTATESTPQIPSETTTVEHDSSTTKIKEIPKKEPEATTETVTETTEAEVSTQTTTETQSTMADLEVTSTTEAESTTSGDESGTTTNTVETTTSTSETTPETDSSEDDTKIEPSSGSTTPSSEDTKSETDSSEDNKDIEPPSVSSTPSTDVEPKPDVEEDESLMQKAMVRVNKLSDQVRLVLMHYRTKHVVVLPGQSFFPEPMIMHDFRQSFSIGTMDFKNMRVYGLSNFTVEHINTDVDRMQVYILLHMKRLVILGNYTLRTFFNRAAGPFNVTLLNVDSEGVAEIQTANEGHLEAADSVMDMFTQDMRIDFKNLGFMGSMFQGMVSTVGDALFNSIKPQILERVNIVIRTDINKKLKEFSTKFINKVAPVDLAFSEGRKYVRNNGYDPYNIRDHQFILGGLVYVNITQFWVEGLSRFFRVGNLSLSMDSGVIQVGVHVMTQKLTGHCVWAGQTFGIVKSGKTNFTIDHLQVRALVNQSLDIRKKPQLDDLDLELGWVKVTMDSPMTLNLMIEGVINAFPRLIRHIIVDTLEQPLKERIQEILNKINVESFVDDNLPRLDNYGL